MPDGGAGSIYGQWPPLVNAARAPGEWQVYDIVFEAPKFAGGKLARPAFVTVFHNGVVLHNRKEIQGPMAHRKFEPYSPHAAEEPLHAAGPPQPGAVQKYLGAAPGGVRPAVTRRRHARAARKG